MRIRYRGALLAAALGALAAAPVSSTANAGAVTALAFSPDGKHLAVGGYLRAVVYDTATWKPESRNEKVEDAVRCLSYSPDGSVLAVGSGLPSRSGDLQLWDPAGKTPAIEFPPQTDTIEAVSFRSDGKGLILAGNDGKAHLYAKLPYRFGPTLDEHNGRVTACAFSPGPLGFFVTGATDKIVKVWDATTQKSVINFDQSEAAVTGLTFLPDGNRVIGSSLDGKLYWWQVGYDAKRKTWGGYVYRANGAHEGGVYSLSSSGDRQRMITTGADSAVKVWRAEDGGQLRVFTDLHKPAYAGALSKDGKIAAAGGEEGTVYVWDVETGKVITTIASPGAPGEAPVVAAVPGPAGKPSDKAGAAALATKQPAAGPGVSAAAGKVPAVVAVKTPAVTIPPKSAKSSLPPGPKASGAVAPVKAVTPKGPAH